MYNTTVSVIMSVYNGDKYLRDAIESILDQTYTDFEFIIINDGSTDNSEEIILSYTDSRIRYIRNEVNLKLIKSLNKGVDLATGRYIARMDADDISLPDRLAKQVEVFSSNDHIDIVNSSLFLLREDGSSFRKQKSDIVLSPEAIQYLIMLQNYIRHPGVMVKAELLKRYKYLDDLSTEHIEDFDLWNRMLMDGCVCYTTDEHLILYRTNSASITHTQRHKQYERMSLLCSTVLNKRLNFKMDKSVLYSILSEAPVKDSNDLRHTNDEIERFISSVLRTYKVSASAHDELQAWRKQKIFLLALKSLSSCSILEKPAILIYILSNVHWLSNKQLRGFIKRLLVTKNYRRLREPGGFQSFATA